MKEKTEKNKSFKSNVLYGMSLLLVVVAFLCVLYHEQQEKFELEQEIKQLSQQAVEAAKYNNEIKDRIKYSDEDEYVEKIAREKLNMIKDDEVIYINKNK